jgi:hypothetical protein
MVVMRMTDIGFLSNADLRSVRCIVYRYLTGSLLRQFTFHASNVSFGGHGMIASCEPNQLVPLAVGAGLFHSIYICNWHESSETKSSTAELIAALETEGEDRFILLVHGSARMLDEYAASHAFLIVEERMVDFRSVSGSLRFVCENGRLNGVDQLWSVPDFQSYFQSWIDDEGSQSYLSFQKEFEKIVLLYTDAESAAFNAPAASDYRSKRSRLARSVVRLIASQDEPAIMDFVAALSGIRNRGASDASLFIQLNAAVEKAVNRYVASPGSFQERRTLSIFLATYVAEASYLRVEGGGQDAEGISDLFVVLLEKIARLYVSIVSREDASEVLVDSPRQLILPIRTNRGSSRLSSESRFSFETLLGDIL